MPIYRPPVPHTGWQRGDSSSPLTALGKTVALAIAAALFVVAAVRLPACPSKETVRASQR